MGKNSHFSELLCIKHLNVLCMQCRPDCPWCNGAHRAYSSSGGCCVLSHTGKAGMVHPLLLSQWTAFRWCFCYCFFMLRLHFFWFVRKFLWLFISPCFLGERGIVSRLLHWGAEISCSLYSSFPQNKLMSCSEHVFSDCHPMPLPC